MGGSSSNSVVDHEGNIVINRRCILLICPPSFETSKFIDSKPEHLDYRYVSVGKLIRDQINKKTHYSKIIMDNLAKYKKVNNQILQVLLKNVALQGNFIIQFCPKDSDDLQIWRKFLTQVEVDLVAVIKPDQKNQASQQKMLFEEKLKSFQRDVQNVKEIFPNKMFSYENDENIWGQIIEKLKSNPKIKN